jgi:hypothetical protein
MDALESPSPADAGAKAAPADAPAPAPAVDEAARLAAFRWLGRATLALVAVVLGVTAALPLLPRGLSRDLAQGRPWRASSALAICHPEQLTCGNGRTSIFFHTRDEPEPWVELDLGPAARFSEVVVHNRRDGDRFVLDRAVPLILEVGDDQKAWRTLGRRDESFGTWRVRFEPTSARYVRLRSPRTTMLHLDGVEVHP